MVCAVHLKYLTFCTLSIYQVYLSELNQREEKDEVYSPHNGRTFLLIVGLERTLVCMLMQQMKLHPSGEVTPPTIDAVYVDRARSLIMELKAQDLLAECDGRSVEVIFSYLKIKSYSVYVDVHILFASVVNLTIIIYTILRGTVNLESFVVKIFL